MAVKNALAKGQNIPAEAAADPFTVLKTIATDG
jgi:3-phenylpropionate/trans-cinnamate dioxygenase ferredoxin reductase subunit